MAGPLLSAVIPVKDPPLPMLRRCLASLQAIECARGVEAVLVDSSASPCVRETVATEFPTVSYLAAHPPRGIYNAYNKGAQAATGEYVLFLGGDDIVLPGLGALLADAALLRERPDVVLARVLVQNKGIVVPRRSRSALVFGNWPHQGMLYRRQVFDGLRFDERFRIQADHGVNIQLAGSGARILTSKHVVCHFSAGGLSSVAIDWPFREAMPALVDRHLGRGWGVLCRARRRAGDIKRFILRQPGPPAA